jgi:hypothetical protein
MGAQNLSILVDNGDISDDILDNDGPLTGDPWLVNLTHNIHKCRGWDSKSRLSIFPLWESSNTRHSAPMLTLCANMALELSGVRLSTLHRNIFVHLRRLYECIAISSSSILVACNCQHTDLGGDLEGPYITLNQRFGCLGFMVCVFGCMIRIIQEETDL